MCVLNNTIKSLELNPKSSLAYKNETIPDLVVTHVPGRGTQRVDLN